MATDDERIGYLARDGAPAEPIDDGERGELDAVRALLVDPSLWEEPSADLGDRVLAAIDAEQIYEVWQVRDAIDQLPADDRELVACSTSTASPTARSRNGSASPSAPSSRGRSASTARSPPGSGICANGPAPTHDRARTVAAPRP